jgi:hypothetical protein
VRTDEAAGERKNNYQPSQASVVSCRSRRINLTSLLFPQRSSGIERRVRYEQVIEERCDRCLDDSGSVSAKNIRPKEVEKFDPNT